MLRPANKASNGEPSDVDMVGEGKETVTSHELALTIYTLTGGSFSQRFRGPMRNRVASLVSLCDHDGPLEKRVSAL